MALPMPSMQAMLQNALSIDGAARGIAEDELAGARRDDFSAYVTALSKAARNETSPAVRTLACALLRQAARGIAAAVFNSPMSGASSSPSSAPDAPPVVVVSIPVVVSAEWRELSFVTRAGVLLDLLALLSATPSADGIVLRNAADVAAAVACSDPQSGQYWALFVAAAADVTLPEVARAAWFTGLASLCIGLHPAEVPRDVCDAGVDAALAALLVQAGPQPSPELASAAIAALPALLSLSPRSLGAARISRVVTVALMGIKADDDAVAAAAADCLCAVAGAKVDGAGALLASIFSNVLEAAKKPSFEVRALDICAELAANPAIEAGLAGDIFDALLPFLGRADGPAARAAFLCLENVAGAAPAAVWPATLKLWQEATSDSAAAAGGARLAAALQAFGVVAGVAGGIAALGMGAYADRVTNARRISTLFGHDDVSVRTAAAWALEQFVANLKQGELREVAAAASGALCNEREADAAECQASLLAEVLPLFYLLGAPPPDDVMSWEKVFARTIARALGGGGVGGGGCAPFLRLLCCLIAHAPQEAFVGNANAGMRAFAAFKGATPPSTTDAATYSLYRAVNKAFARKISDAI